LVTFFGAAFFGAALLATLAIGGKKND